MSPSAILAYREAIGHRFAERLVQGSCVLQSEAGTTAGLPCTVKDGVVKPLSSVNALIGMQVLMDREVNDPRFFTLSQIEDANWTLRDASRGVNLQFLSLSGNDRQATTKRFKVFHASDIEGAGPWSQADTFIVDDLSQAVRSTGDENLEALSDWLQSSFDGHVGAELRLRQSACMSFLRAGSGLALSSGIDFDWSACAELLHATPLALHAAVADAELAYAKLMRGITLARHERQTSEQMKAGESVAKENSVGKVSARIERLFEQRQAILAVPFKDKDRVNDLGAEWHKVRKVWFVPPKVDLNLFKEWNPASHALAPEVSRQTLIDEFRDVMKTAGLIEPDKGIDADGKWHNVAVDHPKNKSNRSGAYILTLEGGNDGVPCGAISNKLTGEMTTWRYDGPQFTPEQRARLREQARVREAEAAREEQIRYEACALHAREIWDMAAEYAGGGYMARKQVSAEGLRTIKGDQLLAYAEFIGESGKSAIRGNQFYTLVPLMTASGEIRNLQAISDDGKVKTYMRDAQKSGLMHVIGADSLDALVEEVQQGSVSLPTYAEGYATGASFRMGTGLPVIVCFDAGNVERIFTDTAARWPEEAITLIAADNDQFFVERMLATLAMKVGVNVRSNSDSNLSVLTATNGDQDVSRSVALGDVIVDGEWHDGPKGKYCLTPQYEADGHTVRSLKLDVTDMAGKKSGAVFANRGLEAGRVCEGQNKNCLVVTPWFDSLKKEPTDWNDLMVREGLSVLCERVENQVRGQGIELSVSRKMLTGLLHQDRSGRERRAGIAVSSSMER
jgi:phage/plasmid primase-like uncharacterized protein